MNNFSKKRVLAGMLIASVSMFNVAHADLIVTQNDTASDLVDNILGSGITTSNLLNIGDANAFGTFTGGLSAGIGFDSGIMLATGDVNNAVGPNTEDDITTNFGTAGDTDLTAIAGGATFDAAILTFDFISDGGDLFFNYVFASEEYNEFVNEGFNDVFAFFLDGSNIALIPGTSTPVAIDTVNGGNPFGTNASNSQYFNNNDLDDGGPFFDIEYDGFTDMFTASVMGLSAGTHTISMRIADSGDAILDSAVFIQAGSFTDTDPQDPPTSVPEPSTLLIFGLGLLGLASRKVRK
ncbi:MAG: choice-of-anchor L domain-containing protein [Cognaticolwellia sp.]